MEIVPVLYVNPPLLCFHVLLLSNPLAQNLNQHRLSLGNILFSELFHAKHAVLIVLQLELQMFTQYTNKLSLICFICKL